MYVYKDNKLAYPYAFESTHDLERRSIELFGVKLLQGKISAVCLGNKPQYKGYVFSYVIL